MLSVRDLTSSAGLGNLLELQSQGPCPKTIAWIGIYNKILMQFFIRMSWESCSWTSFFEFHCGVGNLSGIYIIIWVNNCVFTFSGLALVHASKLSLNIYCVPSTEAIVVMKHSLTFNLCLSPPCSQLLEFLFEPLPNAVTLGWPRPHPTPGFKWKQEKSQVGLQKYFPHWSLLLLNLSFNLFIHTQPELWSFEHLSPYLH